MTKRRDENAGNISRDREAHDQDRPLEGSDHAAFGRWLTWRLKELFDPILSEEAPQDLTEIVKKHRKRNEVEDD